MFRRIPDRSLVLGLALLFLALLAGACSDEDPAGPPAPLPPAAAVTDLRAVGGSTGSVTLAWTVPVLLEKSGPAIRYDLRHMALGGEDAAWEDWDPAPIAVTDTTPGAERRFTVTGLEPNATYAFRVACGTDGRRWSEPSNLVVGTANGSLDTTRPAPVRDLRLDGWTEESAIVSWAVAGDDSIYGEAFDYHVGLAREEITLENWASVVVDSLEWEPAPEAGRLAVSIDNLERFTRYRVAVRAMDDAVLLSGLSATVEFETLVTDTFYVDVDRTGDFPTIGAAILAAGPTDLILVGPGRYTWTNQGTGDPQYGLVTVPRGFTHFEVRSTDGPEATILDAERQGNALYITGGVNPNSEGEVIKDAITVDGFTLTGGLATGQVGVPGEAYAGGGLVFHLSDATIRNCIITGNEATQGGGVWYGGVGHPTFENCVISNNRSPAGGGMLLVNSSDPITLRGCTIRDNVSTGAGGGLLAQNVVFRMENCVVSGNRASSRGGGLSISGANEGCSVENSTIADNQCAEGAAFFLGNHSVIDLHGSIVYSNSGPLFTDQLGSGVVMGCCDLFDNGSNGYRPEVFEDEGGNFAADPLFAGPGVYELTAESPCLPGAHPDGSECGRIGAEPAGR